MRQEEKNQMSRDKILRAAIEEFGGKGYGAASLNALLMDNGLSKGLVYHYFENKDQLYLGCVCTCLDMLTASLSGVERGGDAEVALHSYFELRGRFFREHPKLARIFFEALLQPPVHLELELAEARAGFDAVNRALFRAILSGLQLRTGVSEDDALYYFDLMQSALHVQHRTGADQYEEQARKAVDVLLYGLVGGEQP